MKLNDKKVRLMFLRSPEIMTRSLLSASFFDILCWTGHEGKFLSDEACKNYLGYEIFMSCDRELK